MYFTEEGLLPPGNIELTLNELRQSLLVKGTSDLSAWDENWRKYLVD